MVDAGPASWCERQPLTLLVSAVDAILGTHRHPQSAASPAVYSRSHLVLLNFHFRLSVILNRILGSIS